MGPSESQAVEEPELGIGGGEREVFWVNTANAASVVYGPPATELGLSSKT